MTNNILENFRLAVACGANPSMSLSVAISSMNAKSIDEIVNMIKENQKDFNDIFSSSSDALKKPAYLEQDLCFEPEISKIRSDIKDHELRGKLLFGDLLCNKNFFQVAAFEIAGIDLSINDAELLEKIGIMNQFPNPTIWPINITRRILAYNKEFSQSIVAGISSFCTKNMTALPVAGFMKFLEKINYKLNYKNEKLEDIIDEILENKEIIYGVGRPAFGPDERVKPLLLFCEKYNRNNGYYINLAKEIDDLLFNKKGLRINSAGFYGALMKDLGFGPTSAAAFCIIYFIVPILANVSFTEEKYDTMKYIRRHTNEIKTIEDLCKIVPSNNDAILNYHPLLFRCA